jgi:hypothetical protein
MGSSIMDDQDNSQNLETHELTANTKHPAKPRPKSAGKWNFYASTSSTLGFNDKRSLAFRMSALQIQIMQVFTEVLHRVVLQ